MLISHPWQIASIRATSAAAAAAVCAEPASAWD